MSKNKAGRLVDKKLTSEMVSVRLEGALLDRLDRLVDQKRSQDPLGTFSRTTLTRAAIIRLLESEEANGR